MTRTRQEETWSLSGGASLEPTTTRSQTTNTTLAPPSVGPTEEGTDDDSIAGERKEDERST